MTSQLTLHSINQDLHVWSPQPSSGWGMANCGLLTAPGGHTAAWIDAPYDREMASQFLALSRPLLADGADIDRVIVTHGSGDHLWGSVVLPRAEVISTREALSHLSREPGPTQMHALIRSLDPDTPLGWYLNRSFGRFNWAGTELRRPSTVFTDELELHVGDIPVHLTAVPPAHTTGDLIVHLPRQKTVFSGDILFGRTLGRPGDHAYHWAGPLDDVISACERVLATGAEVIVPGHGPLLDRAGVQAHIGYLEYVRNRTHVLHAEGVPALEAAHRVIAERRYPDMGLPERLVITVATEYRHLDGTPWLPDMLGTLTQVAQTAWELEHPTVPRPRAAEHLA